MEKPIADFTIKFDGSGGLCFNPENSRKTFKVILPGKFTDKIKKVEIFGKDDFYEELYRAKPNEYGERSRYYGRKNIKKYPSPISVFFTLKNGDIGTFKVKNSQKRQD